MKNIISQKIVQRIIAVSNTNPESDQIEVYIYGLDCFLNTGSTIFILLTINEQI